MNSITAEKLRSILSYSPETGEFRWINRASRRVLAGDVAGKLDRAGYRKIGIEKKHYRAHRLAWLYVHGEWPPAEIDHVNGNRDDNRIENLREATRSQNLQNQRRARSNSSTGLLGVCFDPIRGNWRAVIGIGGRQVSLGRHESAELAHAAYVAAKERLHPFFSVGAIA